MAWLFAMKTKVFILGLVCGLLHFTPSPFANLGTFCCGELDTGCVSAAGMKGWVDRLIPVLIGDGCLFCIVGVMYFVFACMHVLVVVRVQLAV